MLLQKLILLKKADLFIIDVLQIVYPGTIYIDACLFFHADELFVVSVALEIAA